MEVHNFDLNNRGQIAGTMTDPNTNKQAFFCDPNDGLQMLGTLGGTESFAKALNNLGQVVGFSHREKNRPQAFIWDKTNGMRSLTPHIQQYGKAHAINDCSQVLGDVGTVIGYSIPHWRPCFWDATDPPAMQATPPQSSDGYWGGSDINNKGYVLHYRSTRQSRAYWVCLWHKDAGLKRLFPRGEVTDLVALNDLNQVLYSDHRVSRLRRWTVKYLPFYGVHYLWDPKRGKILLNDQVPRKLGRLTAVRGMNNRGCILGTINPKGSRRGVAVSVLLEPIPERWGK
jgi:probable HAF family extracellular repeat protein